MQGVSLRSGRLTGDGGAPVKNPTPATQHALTWNQPKAALSTSARAARRRALRSMTAAWPCDDWEYWSSFSMMADIVAGREAGSECVKKEKGKEKRSRRQF